MRMKPGYTDAFWVSILLMVYMILIKNKNKNIFLFVSLYSYRLFRPFTDIE